MPSRVSRRSGRLLANESSTVHCEDRMGEDVCSQYAYRASRIDPASMKGR